MKQIAKYLTYILAGTLAIPLMGSLPWTDNFDNLNNFPNRIGDSGATATTVAGNLVLDVPAGDSSTGPRRVSAQTANISDFNFFENPIRISLFDISLQASEGTTDEFFVGITHDPSSSIITGSEDKIYLVYYQSTSQNLRVRHYKDGLRTNTEDFVRTLPRELGRLDFELSDSAWQITWYDTDLVELDSVSGLWSPNESAWSNFALAIGLDQSRERDSTLQVGSITVIPEPRTTAMLFGGAALGLALMMRMRQ